MISFTDNILLHETSLPLCKAIIDTPAHHILPFISKPLLQKRRETKSQQAITEF